MIAVSARTLMRNVGGNTRYGREVYGRLHHHGVAHVALAPRDAARSRTTYGWGAWEAAAFQASAHRRGAAVAHYPADTGPVRGSSGLVTVVTIQGVGQLHDPDVRRAVPARVWLERTRRAGAVSDVIITGSASSADDIERLVGPAAARRIRLIPNGIDHGVFNLEAGARTAEAQEAHGAHGRYVLFVGNLEPRKNVVPLVEAVDALNRDGHPCELLIAGKPAWDADATVAAIEASPHARRLGFVKDEHLPGLMAGAAAFAFPSRYEGFGLPVVEALASGATVVCSRKGSLPEVAGSHAHYCEAIDAAGIADGLARAFEDGHPTTPQQANAWTARFDWSTSAREHARLFAELGARS